MSEFKPARVGGAADLDAYRRNPFDLTGKIALITGGSRGLGREMALTFAAHGADVVIASRKIENCETVADEVRAFGQRAWAFAAHMGRWDGADQLADDALAATGRIDILVNNAGMSPIYEHILDVNEKLYDAVHGLNAKGPFRLSARLGTAMYEGDGGCIINVSSTAAVRPTGNVIAYAGAKAAVEAMTVAFADLFAPKVRVNCIRPGTFMTDISKAWDLTTFDARARSIFMAGRGGEPQEIVGAALYLASDAGAYTNAMVLPVDGGPR